MDIRAVKILIVEDDEVYSRLSSHRLHSGGNIRYEHTQVKSLNAACEILLHRPFDLILLDLNIEDSSGIETLRRMVKAAGSLPVVVLTGSDDLALAALREGAQDYVVKGEEDSRVLTKIIYYAIERKRAEERLLLRTRELEQLNRVMLGREQKMTELEKEIALMQKRLSRPSPEAIL